MGFDGYFQRLCANGHQNDDDASMHNEPSSQCRVPGCEAGIVWVNLVDDTNCTSYGEIDLRTFFFKRPRSVEACPCCGSAKLLNEEEFSIPTEEETKALRCCRPDYGNTSLVPINKEAYEKVSSRWRK